MERYFSSPHTRMRLLLCMQRLLRIKGPGVRTSSSLVVRGRQRHWPLARAAQISTATSGSGGARRGSIPSPSSFTHTLQLAPQAAAQLAKTPAIADNTATQLEVCLESTFLGAVFVAPPLAGVLNCPFADGLLSELGIKVPPGSTLATSLQASGLVGAPAPEHAAVPAPPQSSVLLPPPSSVLLPPPGGSSRGTTGAASFVAPPPAAVAVMVSASAGPVGPAPSLLAALAPAGAPLLSPPSPPRMTVPTSGAVPGALGSQHAASAAKTAIIVAAAAASLLMATLFLPF